MRIAVCLLVAAALLAGCSTPQKRHMKGPAAAQPSSATTRVKRQRPRQQPAPVRQQPPTQARVQAPEPQAGSVSQDVPQQSPASGTATPSPPAAGTGGGVQAQNPNAGGTTGPNLDPGVYRLGGGDVVNIDVFNEPELSLDAGIDGMGTINYPLLGHIPAAGMTVRELEGRLAEQLRQGYLVNPSVRVSMKRFRPIFIMGMVRRVGAHPYSPGLTIERALAMAGGITEYGSTKKIYVQHPGTSDNEKEKVNLDYTLRPGDTIVVEERLF